MPLKGNNLRINLICISSYLLFISYVYFLYSGCLWKGADENVRRCYPVLLAFQVDYPEACMLTLVRQNHVCPSCTAGKSDFADLQTKQLERTIHDMSKIFYHTQDLEKTGDTKKAQEILQSNGLVNVQV